MRIFITGSNGQLAKSLEEIYGRNELMHYASKYTLDTLDEKEVLSQITAFKPDIVFHFASMTRGEECAKNPEKAWSINVDGTKNVIKACKKTGASLLFVSTNEIFDGEKTTPYTENDTPHPITVVGKTKLEVEKLIKKSLDNYYIIRTSWLYSDWSHNFIHAVLKKAITDKEIELVDDEISSPTYSADLSQAIKKLVETNAYGTYHLANEGAVSRLEFAKKAFQIYTLKNITIHPVHLDHFKRVSKPPLYSALKNSDVKKLGISMPKWDEALERFLTSHDLIASL